MTGSPNATGREPQLAYSEIQGKMHDEHARRQKARKIIRVLHHYLGRDDLKGLSALDIGCSTGIIASELAADGARATGVDIDVPGLEAAQARFGDRVNFICTSADDLPLPDESVDVVVFNHIYEHVVDPEAVVKEIHRVLSPTGVVYLGLGNKYQLMEPHYRLPLLSWLPQRAATSTSAAPARQIITTRATDRARVSNNRCAAFTFMTTHFRLCDTRMCSAVATSSRRSFPGCRSR